LAQIGDYQLPLIDIRHLLRCNLAPEDLPHELRKDKIWNNIWTAWCTSNFRKEIATAEEILNQSIWFNSLIKIGNQTCGIKKWIESGIMWVSDLISEQNTNCRFLHHSEVENKFNIKIPFTEYYGILRAMPKEWHKTLNKEQFATLLDLDDIKLIDIIEDSKRPSKLIYDRLIKEKFTEPFKPTTKWNDNLGINIESTVYIESVNRNRTVTINNKLRSFDYNFYMRNVPYGTRLNKMGKQDNPICQECDQEEEESILHLYWTCPRSERLWERLKHLIELESEPEPDPDKLPANTTTTLPLDPASCLLGIYLDAQNKQQNTLKRILCLLTKYYIHKQKCNGGKRSYEGLIHYISQTYRTEVYLAQKRGTIHQISMKWKQLAKKLDNIK